MICDRMTATRPLLCLIVFIINMLATGKEEKRAHFTLRGRDGLLQLLLLFILGLCFGVIKVSVIGIVSSYQVT